MNRLGRLIQHDPRSRDYPAARSTGPLRKVNWARSGSAFDQGTLGSCTGNAIAGCLNTAPFHLKYHRRFTEADAVSIYALATTLDPFPGTYPPDDIGSSGLAACQAAQKLGYIAGYQHAFGIEHALEALQLGPVITGVDWYSAFDRPDSRGQVRIAGDVRGGHEVEAYGYDPATDLVFFWNSWGRTWGLRGRFCMTSRTWAELLANRGDVTVPVVKAT
jgi:hypothetical protein